ncbi:MAG: methylmalonyl-CoA carboxyltransferase [Deltaproteobacteria bacterium]|nr:methylmalonyl-CoA carboxyltransferase [Deltaproteobacteria bacterium]
MTRREELLSGFLQKKAALSQGGGPEKIEKQHALGKKTAKERLDLLLDQNSFTELDPWIKNRCLDFGLANLELANEGVMAGWGTIDQRRTYVFSNDFTVMGGSLGEAQGLKICRLMDMAMKVGAPIVGLNDSGGARVQEGMGALNGYCSIFGKNSIASGWIPQISVILGPCAGGTVYSPALTDFIIMVDPIAKMFITGPAVIKAVTGEKIGFEELGGCRVHASKTGVAHFVTGTEEEAMRLVQKLLSFMPSNSKEQPPCRATTDPPTRLSPELRDVVPDKSSEVFNVRDIILSIVDDGDFLEVQKKFAQNIVIGFARINGRPVGIVGNQPRVLGGCLDVNASWKAARFVRFCDAFNLPLITFVDCPGYLPGIAQEHNGIIRNGSKLLYAFSEATVPKITVILRKSYGGAYSAMCGKGLGADLVIAFPTAEVAVMGPEAAADVVFKNEIAQAADPVAKHAEMVADYRNRFTTPYKAAEWGLVDDIIDPQELRPQLISALAAMSGKTEWRPYKKHSNLPL